MNGYSQYMYTEVAKEQWFLTKLTVTQPVE